MAGRSRLDSIEDKVLEMEREIERIREHLDRIGAVVQRSAKPKSSEGL